MLTLSRPCKQSSSQSARRERGASDVGLIMGILCVVGVCGAVLLVLDFIKSTKDEKLARQRQEFLDSMRKHKQVQRGLRGYTVVF